ncbi:FAD-dependent oxidoreductase, partial [Curtobacterium sp. B8]|uniref:flavin monoamine oxidase family protein n=1 Tax=Curtobacterium sp. B8 TaxID=95611 RepID=UPI0004CF780C
MTIEKDVVVIGAGVTGLIAANRLVAEGHTVAVLEARDRVGGRTWTNDIEGVTLEIGGQWVSPDQTALLETLVELGLETYDRYREGSSVYIDQHGSRTEYTGDIFPLPEATATEIERLVAVVDEYVAKPGRRHRRPRRGGRAPTLIAGRGRRRGRRARRRRTRRPRTVRGQLRARRSVRGRTHGGEGANLAPWGQPRTLAGRRGCRARRPRTVRDQP